MAELAGRQLSSLGITASFLSTADLASAGVSKYDAILLGVRAYAVSEDLKANNGRLLEYVKNGGVAPYPYSMGTNPEEVTDELSKVLILDPANPSFNWPNKITSADFDEWIEERGSKNVGQEPQRGGLLYAPYGKGVYIYNAYALYRQLPEGVPGAYRLIANMLSVGKAPPSARN